MLLFVVIQLFMYKLLQVIEATVIFSGREEFSVGLHKS